MTSPVLEIRHLSTAFSGGPVHRDLSLHVAGGESVALLGPNGAGKTTLLRAVFGLKKVEGGSVHLSGRNITGASPDQICRMGAALIPQGRSSLLSLTVDENLRLGMYSRNDPRGAKADLEHVLEIFPVLRERLGVYASTLSGGQRQMLGIARGLLSRPTLLALDEPTLGLAPRLVAELGRILADVRRQFGTAVLLVEQHVGLAASVTSRAYVMKNGALIAEGPTGELAKAHLLRSAYLGSADPGGRLGRSGRAE